MALEAGQIIDGKYRIVREIGAGGMGVVYEGENILIRRRVAIKVMIASANANPGDAVRRFEREAQAAGQIGSDHILEVLDLGTLADGDRYMVMEYLDGETLNERIERHGHLTPRQIAPIARQFLAGLASAHAANIIHRDLKPENIFILRSKAGRSDFVKLIDFGVARFAQSPDGHRTTRAGSLLGTPCYMSPEQARGRGEADLRSDIYACGVILFEAVTGKLPFTGETFNDLMFKIALSETPSPLSVLPALDPEFAWIIERAMARDPAARFQTVQEFSEKLDEWMRTNELTGTLAQPPPSDAFPRRVPSLSSPELEVTGDTVVEDLTGDLENLQLQKTGIDESWARSQQKTAPIRRRNLIAIVVASLAMALVVVITAVALRSGPSAEERARAASAGATSVTTGTVSARAEEGIPPPPPPTEIPTATPAVASSTVTPAKPPGIGGTPSSAPRVKGATPKKPAGPAKPLDFGY